MSTSAAGPAGRVPGLTPSSPRGTDLGSLITRERPLVVPGVVHPLAARLVEQAGFDACYVTGAGVSNALFGLPDVGLVTMTEVLESVRRITAAVSIPVIVDGDNGHGGPLSVMRTTRMFEAAGASAIQLEDQAIPKKCGHFDGKELVSAEEMLARIKAASTARTSTDFLIIARTDAGAVEGIDAAIDRARAYRAAGADVLFVEAPTTVEQLELVGNALKDEAPLLVNIVEGGRTPELPAAELSSLGFSIILHANMLMRVMAYAGREALSHLATTGETKSLSDKMLSWDERQRLVFLSEAEHLEKQLEAH